MLGWALLTLSTVQAAQGSSQAMADRVAACGVGTVAVRDDPELQDDIISVAPAAAVTDAQLACADRAAPTAFFTWPDAVQGRFDSIRRERGRAIALDVARRWLSSRGLLDRVPSYQPGVDDGGFVRRVEALCGPRAKGAVSIRSGMQTINEDWLRREAGRASGENEAITCLLYAGLLADFPLGFVGNEAE